MSRAVEAAPTRTADPEVQRRWEESVAREVRRRMKVLKRIHDKPAEQAKVLRYLSESGADGLVAFARDWCWTYDPRAQSPIPKNCPLVLWPRQEALLRALYETAEVRENLLIDKSRDTGVTWLIAGVYFTWRWLFVDNWAGAMGSRKEELLDRLDDPKCLFAKPRWIIGHLPRWMLPLGYNPHLHNHFKRIVNPANGATMTGEAGPEMGRGGRAADYFLDEFGVMPRAQQVDAAVSGNSHHVIYCHTAGEPGTYMDEIRTGGRARVFSIGWEHDPRKDPGYRDRFLAKYGARITAKELDRDWSASGGNSIIPTNYIRAAIGLELKAGDQRPQAGLDVADGGSAESVYALRTGPVLSPLEGWRGLDPVQTAGRAAALAERDGASHLRIDSIGVGSGTVGALNARRERLLEDGERPRFEHIGVNVGESPTVGALPDAKARQNSARFLNLKAQLWWSLRLRFENSWKRVELGEDIPDDQCISIPDDPVLIAQLSAPQLEHTEKGLMRVESKRKMQSRGIPSPDRADAVILAFAGEAVEAKAPRFARVG